MTDGDRGSSLDELKRLRAIADAERPETIAWARRCGEAMQEQSVSGQLRRAIAADGFRYEELAAVTGIPADDLSDFMAGDLVLTSTAVDRLAAEMHH